MYKKCYESLVKKFLSLPDEPAVIVLINRSKGGQLISDCLTYYFRQAMKSENSSASYTIPNKSVYGSEYSTCVNASKSDLKNFSSGSFAEEKGYGSLPYGYTFQKYGANSPMTFTTDGKALIIVFKANSSGMGNLLVTKNQTFVRIKGNLNS